MYVFLLSYSISFLKLLESLRHEKLSIVSQISQTTMQVRVFKSQFTHFPLQSNDLIAFSPFPYRFHSCFYCHFQTIISLFRQLELSGIRPDIYLLTILTNCYCHLDCVDLGFSLMGKIRSRNTRSNKKEQNQQNLLVFANGQSYFWVKYSYSHFWAYCSG